MPTICVVVNDVNMLKQNLLNSPHANKHRIIWYDNSTDNVPIPVRYNTFIKENLKSNDWMIFCHQDFEFLSDPSEILADLPKDRIFGPVGVRAYTGDNPIPAGRKREIIGRIKCGADKKGEMGLKISGWVDALNVDCCCVLVHSSLFLGEPGLRFDEKLTFHQYSEELSINAGLNFGISTGVVQMDCGHYGVGCMDQEYMRSLAYICDKHGLEYFLSTCNKGEA